MMAEALAHLPVVLVVKAPNQKVEDQTIEVESKWTVRQLKQHLSKVYPGQPDENKQRIIYSGKLLSDKMIIDEVLQKCEGAPHPVHTVHLVCPNSSPPATVPSSIPPSSSETTVSPQTSTSPSQENSLTAQYGIPESELNGLYQEYYAYLQSFYCQQYISALHHQPDGGSAPVWPAPVNGEQVGRADGIHQRPAAAPQANAPAAPAAQAAAPAAQQQQQEADGGLGGFLGGMMEGGGEPEQPRDILDYLYFAIRMGLLLFIIHYYSSMDKVAVAFVLFTVIYLLQRHLRPGHQAARIVEPQAPVVPPPVVEEVAVGDNDAATPEPHQMDRGTGDESIQDVNNPPTNQITSTTVQPATAQMLLGVRVVMETMFQFVVSFFTSLIPDRPPPVNMN